MFLINIIFHAECRIQAFEKGYLISNNASFLKENILIIFPTMNLHHLLFDYLMHLEKQLIMS